MLTPQQINQFKSILEKQQQEVEQTIQTHETMKTVHLNVIQ